MEQFFDVLFDRWGLRLHKSEEPSADCVVVEDDDEATLQQMEMDSLRKALAGLHDTEDDEDVIPVDPPAAVKSEPEPLSPSSKAKPPGEIPAPARTPEPVDAQGEEPEDDDGLLAEVELRIQAIKPPRSAMDCIQTISNLLIMQWQAFRFLCLQKTCRQCSVLCAEHTILL